MTSAPATHRERLSTTVAPELVALLQSCSENLTDDTAKLVTADWCAENGYESLEWLLRWLANDERQGLGLHFTGSRCYGTPKPDSDFDWVFCAENGFDIEFLRTFCDSDSSYGNCTYAGTTGIDTALRYGPVNLLCVSKEAQWKAWVDGTTALLEKAPVTRDQACVEFQSQFRANNLQNRIDY